MVYKEHRGDREVLLDIVLEPFRPLPHGPVGSIQAHVTLKVSFCWAMKYIVLLFDGFT